MLMPQSHRRAIYEHLFKEGVMVAKKEYSGNHPVLKHIPNLHVIKALKSLESRQVVEGNFAWRHHYFTLTNDGINYLREYLQLPNSIVPATHTKKSTGQERLGYGRGGLLRGGPDGDRAGFRRPDSDKTAEIGAGGASFEFRGGGFGRGKPM